MSAAIDLLTEARRHGVTIRREGDRLKVRAKAPPPPDLVERLRESRGEVLALLSQTDRSAGPAEWGAEDWLAFFDERAGIAEFDGGLSRAEAEARAWECAISHWTNTTPIPDPLPSFCPVCDRAFAKEAGSSIPALRPGGGHVWLHPGCHGRYMIRRRAEAKRALVGMGLTLPEGWRP